LAEVRVVDHLTAHCECVVVQDIECFRAVSELEPFCKIENFRGGQIPIEVRGAVEGIQGKIPHLSRLRIAEATGNGRRAAQLRYSGRASAIRSDEVLAEIEHADAPDGSSLNIDAQIAAELLMGLGGKGSIVG